jgi:hypothetical protein
MSRFREARNARIRATARQLGLSVPTDDDLDVVTFPRGPAAADSIERWLRDLDRRRRAEKRLARLHEYLGTRPDPDDADIEFASSVYFLGSLHLIKIGRATKLRARLRGIQLQSAAPVELLHAMPGGPLEERALHKRFADLRVHGEWFRAAPSLLAHIEGLRASG